jgi:hypothetical protein
MPNYYYYYSVPASQPAASSQSLSVCLSHTVCYYWYYYSAATVRIFLPPLLLFLVVGWRPTINVGHVRIIIISITHLVSSPRHHALSVAHRVHIHIVPLLFCSKEEATFRSGDIIHINESRHDR